MGVEQGRVLRESTWNRWRDVKLGDLIDIKHGYAFKGSFFRDEPRGDILLTPGNFAVGGGFKGDKLKYYDGSVPDDFILREGDLLVTMTDLSKQSDTLGYPALVPASSEGRRYLHNQRLGRVVSKHNADTDLRYIYYVMCSDAYRNEVLASSTGTAVKHTSPGRIKQFRFRLPPLPQQRAIAHVLGTLDDKIALNRRMNQTFEEMARALFQSWFVDFDPVRAKATLKRHALGNRADPDVATSDDGATRAGEWTVESARAFLDAMDPQIADLFPDRLVDSELGGIPEGWGVTRLKELSALNPESWSRRDRPHEVEYVDLANTKWGVIETTQHFPWNDAPSRARRVLRSGDTIVGTVRPANGSYSLVGRGGLTGSTGFAVLRPAHSHFRELIYLAATASENIERLAHRADGAAYPAVRPEIVAETKAAVPAKPDNELLWFSVVVGPMLDRMESNKTEIHSLTEQRDALLSKLIAGEIQIKTSV